MTTPRFLTLALASVLPTLTLPACEDSGSKSAVAAEAEDGLDDAFTGAGAGGKADGDLTDCDIESALAYVNAPATTFDVLRAAGVPSRSAKNVVANRPYSSLEALDAVPYVGPVTFERVLAAAPTLDCEAAASGGGASVIFSPQPYETSHLVRVAALIDDAQRSLDIAVYSFSDAGIFAALERAVARGVSVRMLFEPARAHNGRPEGTMSARLEAAGVDVHFINKIMHHKFVLVDGPRDSVEQAKTATLATGSGNWSSSAGTRYDENTVFLDGNAEANLRFQREFNHLWENSRDLVVNTSLADFASLPIDDSTLASVDDDPSFDVVYTSANFEVSESRTGPSFSSVRDRNFAGDRLVELIKGARTSIRVASGHLRARPIAQALIDKHRADPAVDIRVYLDGQEYLSESAHRSQDAAQQECLAAAGDSETKREDCLDVGYLWGYAIHQAGIPTRFKYYAYRWNAGYASQMHHKYIAVDGETLASGSYNFSENAEHGTMENVVFYDAAGYPELLKAFEDNFDALWTTGERDALYSTLLTDINDGGETTPIVFPPMALTWPQVTDLKSAIRTACPKVDDAEYRTNAVAYKFCSK